MSSFYKTPTAVSRIAGGVERALGSSGSGRIGRACDAPVRERSSSPSAFLPPRVRLRSRSIEADIEVDGRCRANGRWQGRRGKRCVRPRVVEARWPVRDRHADGAGEGLVLAASVGCECWLRSGDCRHAPCPLKQTRSNPSYHCNFSLWCRHRSGSYTAAARLRGLAAGNAPHHSS